MRVVKTTDLRNHLSAYLAAVQRGEELLIKSRGKVVARLVPEQGDADAARERLRALRDTVHVGDLLAPLDAEWGAT